MKFILIEDYCKGCGYCIQICPKNVLKESNRLNKRGYILPESENSNECIYCKKCELICPEMALTIEKEEAEI
jgi:2-oxoglutarate ferredoxin oxidoreductase subunit delta